MRAPGPTLLLLIAAASPPAFKVEKKTSLYSYSYDWPSEAVAIPSLHRKLTARMRKDRDNLIAMATAAKKEGGWFPPGGYESNMGWELAGHSARLLSLGGGHWQFTGGAHGNGGSSAILWDVTLDREIPIQGLLKAGTSWNGARPTSRASSTGSCSSAKPRRSRSSSRRPRSPRSSASARSSSRTHCSGSW